jgi:hypothetical protein
VAAMSWRSRSMTSRQAACSGSRNRSANEDGPPCQVRTNRVNALREVEEDPGDR